jgi:hypothetical protein
MADCRRCVEQVVLAVDVAGQRQEAVFVRKPSIDAQPLV